MNLYLIESTSRVLMEQEIESFLNGATNKIIMDASESSIDDLLSEASYVSMFGEMKYLIVKNADFFGSKKLSEEEEEKLLHYFEEPYPLCTVLFTTYHSVDQRRKVTKVLKEKYYYKCLVPPKGLELYNAVVNLLVQKKYYAEKEVIQYIIMACLSHYDLIFNEIEKIDLYFGKPTKLKLEDVKQIVSKTITDNNFKFLDAVLSKDLKKSLRLLEELTILKVEPLSLINLLAREYRNMLEVKYMSKQNYGLKDIKSTLQLQDWQLEKTKKSSLEYHEDDLKDYLIRLEKLDYQIKSGKIDKLVGLKLFLIDLYEY